MTPTWTFEPAKLRGAGAPVGEVRVSLSGLRRGPGERAAAQARWCGDSSGAAGPTAHPFRRPSARDVRITTRFDEHYSASFFGVCRKGHASTTRAAGGHWAPRGDAVPWASTNPVRLWENWWGAPGVWRFFYPRPGNLRRPPRCALNTFTLPSTQ